MLEETIQKNLVVAMKERNETKVAALRSIKAAIQNEKTNGKFHELSDSDIISLIQKLSKQRKESAEIYNQAGRLDLAQKELEEGKYIDEYLPTVMDNDTLEKTIREIISEINATSIKQMGLVMKTLKERFSGQYDSSSAAAKIKEILSV